MVETKDIPFLRGLDTDFNGEVDQTELQQENQSLSEALQSVKERLNHNPSNVSLQETASRLQSDLTKIGELMRDVKTNGVIKYFRGVQTGPGSEDVVSPEEFKKMSLEERERLIKDSDGVMSFEDPEAGSRPDGLVTLPELMMGRPENYKFHESIIAMNRAASYQMSSAQTASGHTVLEVDLPNPEGQFVFPDIVMTPDHQVIMSYTELYSRSDFEGLKTMVGMREVKREDGGYDFFLGDKKTTQFEAYAQIATAAFVEDLGPGLGMDISSEQRTALREALNAKQFIPIFNGGAKRGRQDPYLYVYDKAKGTYYAIWLNKANDSTADASMPEDYIASINNPRIVDRDI